MLAEEVLTHADRRGCLSRCESQTRDGGRELLAHRPTPSQRSPAPRPDRDHSGGGASVNPRRGSGRRPLTDGAWPPLRWLAGPGGWSLVNELGAVCAAISILLTRFASSCPSGLLAGPAPESIGRSPASAIATAPPPRPGGISTPVNPKQLSRTQCLLARLPLPSALGLPSRIPARSATKLRSSFLPSPHALSLFVTSRNQTSPAPPLTNTKQGPSDSTSITRRGSEVEARGALDSASEWGGAGSEVSAPRTVRGHLADTCRGDFADTSRPGFRPPLGLTAIGRLLAPAHTAQAPRALSEIVIPWRQRQPAYLRIPPGDGQGPTKPSKPRHLDSAPSQAQTVGFLRTSRTTAIATSPSSTETDSCPPRPQTPPQGAKRTDSEHS